jgi:hypothetical protein
MLTNAPIDRGNRGGPAVRGDGTVAGVVTQMRVGGTNDNAAIVFTTAAVQPLVADFIDEPRAVLSDCGFGPDYVPPVPENLTLPAELPPPPVTATTAPIPRPTAPRQTSTTAPGVTSRPTSTTVPCPSGEVAIEEVTFQAQPTDDASTWHFTVDAVVANRANAGILVSNATAFVDGTTGAQLDTDFTEPLAVEEGSSTPFRIEGEISSDTEPTLRRLDLAYTWASSQHRYCTTPPVFVED